MKIKIIIQETNQRIPLTRKNPIENEDINDPFTEERSMFGSGFGVFEAISATRRVQNLPEGFRLQRQPEGLLGYF